METITLKRDDLIIDGGTQARFELSEETIDRYAALMKDGVEFPALKVVYDGARYWLWEGLHRVNAGDRIGKETWKVDVTQGTQQDAVWLSYSANTDHGLPRSRAEIERIVLAALTHPRGKGMTDAALAVHTGTTKDQVRYIRTKAQVDIAEEIDRRKGVDGKTYKAPAPRSAHSSSTPNHSASNGPAPAPPPPLTDKAKRPIDKDDYYNLVTAREAIAGIRQRFIEAKQTFEAITKAIDKDPKAAQFAKHPAFKSITKMVFALPDYILDLGKYEPHTACPYCKGEGACEVCRESRWVTAQQFEDCPPEVQKLNGPTFTTFQSQTQKRKVA